jgi:hypothetical protein
VLEELGGFDEETSATVRTSTLHAKISEKYDILRMHMCYIATG